MIGVIHITCKWWKEVHVAAALEVNAPATNQNISDLHLAEDIFYMAFPISVPP